MPYLAASETDDLALPSAPDYWVRMKRRARFGDAQEATSAMISMAPGLTPGELTPDVEVGAYLRTLALRLIVDWNLTDENDKPLPITRASLDQLDPEDGQFIVDEAQKRLEKRSPEKQAPFLLASGRRSKGGR